MDQKFSPRCHVDWSDWSFGLKLNVLEFGNTPAVMFWIGPLFIRIGWDCV